ncbi:reprolysin family propeptide domain-containing protein [Phthorimaea operculella]|nr:reprolysin family propeptide domain-containing protein [Phthorimaea operculella]
MYWKRVLLAATLSTILDVKSEQLFESNEHTKQLLDHLTEPEKLFLFGANHHYAEFEITHIKHSRRRRRSLLHADEDLVSIKQHLDIRLSPRSTFLDPQFLMMKRWLNHTELVLDQHGDEELDACYYRSENAALYVCDDVRGIIKSNSSLYTIHPLPERFHTEDFKAHVIVKKKENNIDQPTCIDNNDVTNTHNPVNNKTWTKHRRKRDIEDAKVENNDLEGFKLDLAHRNKTIGAFIKKLVKDPRRQKRAILPAIFVETAVFVDRDLYKHMTVNFPKETERELVRFVLAMINAVQLLYHDPSLGRPVNFILKRLEILHEDPVNLKRPHDIDRFLSNFCTWQRLENPPGDNDPLHWDHALILTGLDLYVVNKNGKVSSQVVALEDLEYLMKSTSIPSKL